MSSPLIVGILEDDPHMRDYLSHLVAQADDMELGFACETLADAMVSIETVTTDICLVDMQLPDGNGLDFIKAVRSGSDSKALILTVLGDRESVVLAFQSGASGYILKDAEPKQILAHMRSVMKGGSPISSQAATHLLTLLAPAPDSGHETEASPEDDVLTEREKTVLIMFSRGLSYKETAAVMEISPHTVSGYVKSIYGKLEVHSRGEAVFEAIQQGWLDM